MISSSNILSCSAEKEMCIFITIFNKLFMLRKQTLKFGYKILVCMGAINLILFIPCFMIAFTFSMKIVIKFFLVILHFVKALV